MNVGASPAEDRGWPDRVRRPEPWRPYHGVPARIARRGDRDAQAPANLVVFVVRIPSGRWRRICSSVLALTRDDAETSAEGSWPGHEHRNAAASSPYCFILRCSVL